MNKHFLPLPPEQRLTEEKLIKLERRIAKAAKKNEQIRIMSEYYASFPEQCLGEGSIEDEENSEKKYTKK